LNPSNAPVGISLGGQCGPQYRVTSCSDDYTEALTLHAQCGATCPEVPQCVSGACNDEPTGVSNAVTDEWDGVRYTGRPGPMGTCNERIVASAGRYRVQVPVYPAVLPRQPTGGADWTPLSTVSVDFTLPAPGNVVNVFVDRGTLQAGIDAGTAVPEGCRPVAARRFDVANGCYLPVAEVPGLCMFEPDPKEALTGIDEIVCLAAPDGTRYVAAKSFSECLAGPGWTTEPSGVGNGWIVRSNEGLARCQQSTADYVGGDAGFLEDTACEAAIGLGHAYLNPKDLSFGFSGVDASSDAVECAPGTP
jgi:hypothetical protein